MKRVFIDITRLVLRVNKNHFTGIDRVIVAYAQFYKNNAQAVISIREYCFVLSKKQSEKIFGYFAEKSEFSLKKKMSIKKYLKILNKIILILRKQKYLIPFFWHVHNLFFKFQKSVEKKILLNISHSELSNVNYPKIFDSKNISKIFLLHDLIPIEYPEYCLPVAYKRHINILNNMLTKAQGVIVNSNATLLSLKNYAMQRNYILPPIIYASLAHEDFLVKKSEILLPKKPYFVMLGTIEARKNHLLLLHIWRRLIEVLGARAPILVIIGQRGWECEQVIDLLERCQILKDFVIEGIVDDADVAAYLKHAQALLFPSFVEGYGIPLIEALACGTPVIASNLSVFQEIAGDIPEYLDPLDGKGWLDIIIDYSNISSEHRAAQLKRITTFKVPTWEEHFGKIDKFMEQFSELE